MLEVENGVMDGDGTGLRICQRDPRYTVMAHSHGTTEGWGWDRATNMPRVRRTGVVRGNVQGGYGCEWGIQVRSTIRVRDEIYFGLSLILSLSLDSVLAVTTYLSINPSLRMSRMHPSLNIVSTFSSWLPTSSLSLHASSTGHQP